MGLLGLIPKAPFLPRDSAARVRAEGTRTGVLRSRESQSRKNTACTGGGSEPKPPRNWPPQAQLGPEMWQREHEAGPRGIQRAPPWASVIVLELISPLWPWLSVFGENMMIRLQKQRKGPWRRSSHRESMWHHNPLLLLKHLKFYFAVGGSPWLGLFFIHTCPVSSPSVFLWDDFGAPRCTLWISSWVFFFLIEKSILLTVDDYTHQHKPKDIQWVPDQSPSL